MCPEHTRIEESVSFGHSASQLSTDFQHRGSRLNLSNKLVQTKQIQHICLSVKASKRTFPHESGQDAMASPESSVLVQMRSSTSCDSCRGARRKCDANPVSCAWCSTHGISCVYTPRKRRGPSFSASCFSNPTLSAVDVTPTGRDRWHATGSMPQTSSTHIMELVPHPVCHAGDFATPQLPPMSSTPDDLRHAIRFANRAFLQKLVDEESFFSALGEPAHEAPSGLRSCAFALLSLKSRMDGGDATLADTYIQHALCCIDRSMFERPNRYLVSALLLLAIMPPPIGHHLGGHGGRSAAVHAALAEHFSSSPQTSAAKSAYLLL